MLMHCFAGLPRILRLPSIPTYPGEQEGGDIAELVHRGLVGLGFDCMLMGYYIGVVLLVDIGVTGRLSR